MLGLTLDRPWALLALLGLIPLYLWHRQALLAGGQRFTAFFLLPGRDGDRGHRGRLRSPWLFAARAGALALMALALAGPRVLTAGDVLIAAGPPGAATDGPVIRAGRPPTVEAEPDWPPVIGPPDWSAALALAREVAPAGRVSFAAGRLAAIRAAGAALDGGAVVISATVAPGAEAPRLRIGAREIPLVERAGDWFFRGPLPAGPAAVISGGEAWPLCIPDTRPLPVADRGWPPAVEALLSVLPDIERVPPEQAVWRVGAAPARDRDRAPFAPAVVFFELGGEPTRAAAPLWFADGLPPPGAIARRWRPLDDPATPVLLAGDAVVADVGAGINGAGRRFGFDPADTDLPATAGWPVLFVDAVAHDRAARGRCFTHVAGHPLILRVATPLRVTDARGATRALIPTDGRVRVTGLDAMGHARLEAGGERAHIAVVPPYAARVDAAPAAPLTAPPQGTPWAAPLVGLAVALLLLGLGLGARRPILAVAALAASALYGGSLPGGGPRPVTVLVDTSASMPPAETRQATAAVMEALGDRPSRRLMSAPTPWRVPGELGPFDLTARDPLLTLQAAPPQAVGEGALILISDGRDPELPRDFGVPVLAVPVSAQRPDARVVHASAVQLGDQIFVRATVAADRAGPARVTIGAGDGATAVELRLATDRPQSVQAVLPAPSVATALDQPAHIPVRITMADDRQPANDHWPTPIAGERPPQAVVVGSVAAPWAEAAGMRVIEVPAAALAESGARLAQARAMWIHDQPAARLDPALVARLRRWVEAGGVLLLAGRAAAFGPGGWRGTPLDELSPLTAEPRPPGSGRLAVALVLDRSGSIAAEAGGLGTDALGRLAGSVAAGLRPDDLLTVIAFGGAVETLLPPTPIRALGGAVPSPTIARGGTRLAPALERARALLAPLPAEVRIAVIVGDGNIADPEPTRLAAAALAEADVRIMFALAGPDPDRALAAALASQTDGAVIDADGAGLALAVSAGIHEVGEGGPSTGGPVTAEGGWSGRVGGLPPPVEARVRVGVRDGARVLARVAGDALLAEWSVGQGRVVALATDRWDLTPEQWSSLLAPATAPRPGDVLLTVEDDALVYRGPVAEPPPGGPLRIRAAEVTHTARWSATGPGEARAPLPEGPVELLEISAATARGAIVEPIVRPPPAELRHTGLDRGALERQAVASGGAVVMPQEVPAALRALALDRGWPWAPIALALALGLLLVETRRWSAAP